MHKSVLAALVVMAGSSAVAGAGIMGSGLGDGGGAVAGGAVLGGSIAPAAAAGLVIDPTTFWLYPDYTTGGPLALDDALTGATFSGSLTLQAACDARDAGASTWVCRTNGGGTATFTAGVSAATRGALTHVFGDGSSAVTFSSSARDDYTAPNATLGDVGAQDAIVELVFDTRMAATNTILGKKDDFTTSAAGWAIGCAGSPCSPRMYMANGTSQTYAAGTTMSGVVSHMICFYSENNASGFQCCTNGVCGTANSTTGITGTHANANSMGIGGNRGGETAIDGTGSVFAVRIWTAPAGTIVTSERAAIAMRRSAQVDGAYPLSAAGAYSPTTKTRATSKYVDWIGSDDVRRLHLRGPGSVSVARRKELTGGEYVEGLLIEATHTNLCLQSQTFANASWTENNIDAVAEGSSGTPDPTSSTADTLESTDAAGSVEHFMRQAITLTATSYTASVYARAGADSTVTHAWIRDNTVANAIGWVNLSTCAAGTMGAGASQLHAENWGNGWCRFGITFTGTVAAHDVDIGYSNADNVTAYDDGTNANSDLIVWGAQVEAQLLPLSYVLTTTASASSTADNLQYAAASNAQTATGTLSVSAMMPNYDSAFANLAWLGVSTDTNNYIETSCNNADDLVNNVASGGATQYTQTYTAADCSDGERHNVITYWTTNRALSYYDTVATGTEDTSVTVPASFTTIFVGQQQTGAAATCGLISDLHIYNDVRTP